MVTVTDAATVTTDEAARIVGVSARTIRRWIQHGLLSATTTPDGYLIAAADLAGVQAGAGQRPRPRGHAATDTDTTAATATATDADTLVTVNPNARAQLEAIRDEWLQPLVTQIATQAERIGHLEAERDELRRRVEVAEAALAAIAHTGSSQAAPMPPRGTHPPPRANDTKEGIWGRLRRRWGRE